MREYASDDATIVIGTVIDPEMTGELRVTVVATGIGNQGLQGDLAPKEPKVRLVERTAASDVDYRDYDRPTVQRKKVVGEGFVPSPEDDLEYLDIPAFLRRQAD